MSNLKLFGDSDEEDADQLEDVNKLSINTNYAENYEKWRRKEEYQKLKDKYGEEALDSDSDSSSENDGLAEPDNKEFDKDFFRCLAAVRLKHSIVDEKEKFFKDSYAPCSSKQSQEEPQSLSIKEFHRNQIIQQMKDGSIEESTNVDSVEAGKMENSSSRFVFNDGLSDDDEFSDVFTRNEKSSSSSHVHSSDKQMKETTSEVLEFLKGKKTSLQSDLDAELLKGLKNEWETKMTADDKFLMDYFVNQRYLDDENESIERAPNHVAFDFEPLEEDEKTLERMEEYETKYRFRFEEPDEEFIRRYPRAAENSLRKKDTSRMEERQRKKEMERHRREQKEQELKRLKALKKKEILQRIERLEKEAGRSGMGFETTNLDSDFDPEQHDAAMSKIFGDDYYNEGDDRATGKPGFEDEEMKREIDEEYEKLDRLDDMTEGTFKYEEVFPNSYGLSTKEILYAKDSELNRWYSMKLALRVGKSEESERLAARNYSRRAESQDTKKKILPSLFSDDMEEIWRTEEEKKRIRNQKKKERRLRKKEIESKELEAKIEGLSASDTELDKSSDPKNEEERTNASIVEDEAEGHESPSSTKPDEKKKKRKKKSKLKEVLQPDLSDNKNEDGQNDDSLAVQMHLSKNDDPATSAIDIEVTNNSNTTKAAKKRRRKNEKETEMREKDWSDQQPLRKRKLKFNNSERTSKRAKESEELKGISDGRLKAYGANPKKIKNYLKYRK